MTVPTKAQQVAEVMRFLDADRNEGRDLKVIATEIVDGYHDLLLKGLRTPDVVIRDGMLIKTAVSGKVHRVLLLDDDQMWVVSEAGGHGWLGPTHTQFWDGAEEYRPKRRVEIDGKGKMVEMTDEEIAQEWTNADGWKPGDILSRNQRQHHFKVIAVAPTSVLMWNPWARLMADSNKNLEKYYKKERSSSQESTLGSDW